MGLAKLAEIALDCDKVVVTLLSLENGTDIETVDRKVAHVPFFVCVCATMLESVIVGCVIS